jgi:23S rRNA (uracil1939-C5)-methyltransferase
MSSDGLERFELVPEKLVYGGAALGHHAGRPVLVPYALPGEQVQVEAAREAKGMVFGRLLRVLDPAAERVAARCPYFAHCGGCHYQHLAAARQLEIKREILRETLRRVGRIDWQGEIITRAAEPWNYRNQVQLKIGAPRGSVDRSVGFFAADSHHLVAIESCPIASPRLNAVIGELARPEWAARLAGWTEVELRTDDRDEGIVLTFRGQNPDPDSASMERLTRECMSLLPGAVGAAFELDAAPRSGARTRRSTSVRPVHRQAGGVRTFGETALVYRVGEFAYRVSPGSFFQSSRLLLPEFATAVTSEPPGAPALAIDLYAGVGLFTLPLARIFRQVLAIEANRRAAADLEANLQATTQARAVRSTAAEFLRRYAQPAPALVVLDPPRAGADAETLRRLCAIAPAELRYVSCHPPTLARDLAMLVRSGYVIERVELFDLFPQTFHIESVVRLRKS